MSTKGAQFLHLAFPGCTSTLAPVSYATAPGSAIFSLSSTHWL